MTSPNAVQADDVWKRYGNQDVLKGLYLSVPEGAAYALIGANGAGKTTTLKILMNIMSPSRGTVTLLGSETQRVTTSTLSQIGYVSENQVLPGRLTVAAYLEYLRPFYPTWDAALEKSLRERLQLPPDARIGELSHGQRIKVQLASALAFRPKLMILDEPFSGLDPLVREEFMDGLLLQAGEMTLLISSHELAEIEHVCTHVGMIDAGAMLFEAATCDLQARFRQVRVTLDRAATVPDRLPTGWLQPQAFGHVFSFIDARYVENEVRERIGTFLGPVRRIDAQPLPLRTLFTSLARAAREGIRP
jgi:ABC-2 type transport system ATP-binding protein